MGIRYRISLFKKLSKLRKLGQFRRALGLDPIFRSPEMCISVKLERKIEWQRSPRTQRNLRSRQ